MSGQKTTAVIGLGSNLGNRLETLSAAATALADLSRDARRSPLYESAPLGPPQPDYLNAVVLLTTSLEPEPLVQRLLAIELALGRIRRERWGPRLIDLDLLVLGDRRLTSATVTVPHPEIAKRAFVLRPWADVAPDMLVPGLGTVSDLLARLPESDRAAVKLFRQTW